MITDFLKHLGWLLPAPADFRQQLIDFAHDGKQLRRLATYSLDGSQLHQLGRALLKARQVGSASDLERFNLAILSNSTAEHLTTALIGTACRYGIDLHVKSFSYDEAFAVAVTGDERLRDFNPNLVLVAIDHKGLPLRDAVGDPQDEQSLITGSIAYLKAIYNGVRKKIGCACLLQTVASPPGFDFGHSDQKISGTLRRIISSINNQIYQEAEETPSPLLDIDALSQMVGTAHWFDSRFSNIGKIPFAMEFIPLYSDHLCRVLGALFGKSRRVLVLDLDNTLWGGVVGDDGVEGIVFGNGTAAGESFLDLQRKVLSLRNRGILLAVCSKNDHHQAMRPFKERSDMILKEDSFVAFMANWNDKAANIMQIASDLSLGLSSFVFLDDNPAERALVRSFLPEVAVPELPQDPAGYAFALEAAGYFEAITYSREDARRSDLYRSKREMAAVDPHDLASYLKSLGMRLMVSDIDGSNRERVLQLINKSNQFNLTTWRLTESDIARLSADREHEALVLRLIDKFNDHGIISVVLGEVTENILDICLWVMSCRVIGRGVEKAALQCFVDRASQKGLRKIRGKYIPTARNSLVANHYQSLGFDKISESPDGITSWELDLIGLPNLTDEECPIAIEKA